MRLAKAPAWGVLLLVAVLGSGCGLDVMVTCDPASPEAGEEVDCTLMVKNTTDCTVDDVEAFILTFIPTGVVPSDLCALIEGEIPSGLSAVQGVLEQHLPPAITSQLLTAAESRMLNGSPQGSGQAFVCTESGDGIGQGPPPFGSAFECILGDLDPGEKTSIQFSAEAPFSGPFDTLAFAVGDLPEGESCPPAPPGSQVALGCFNSALTANPAPAVSPLALATLITALVGVGAFALRRQF